jgi:hypothetical protein
MNKSILPPPAHKSPPLARRHCCGEVLGHSRLGELGWLSKSDRISQLCNTSIAFASRTVTRLCHLWPSITWALDNVAPYQKYNFIASWISREVRWKKAGLPA